MGRLILVLLIIATLVAVWIAFVQPALKARNTPATPEIKGPDDDDAFLWNLEKERYKKRQEQENKDTDPDKDDPEGSAK